MAMIAWRETLMAGALLVPLATATRTPIDYKPKRMAFSSKPLPKPPSRPDVLTQDEASLFSQVSAAVAERHRVSFGLTIIDESMFPPGVRGQTIADLCARGRLPRRIPARYFPAIQDIVQRKGARYFLRRLSYFQEEVQKKDSLWHSVYLSNPSADDLYKRSAFHEIGMGIFDVLMNDHQDLILNFADIDVASECWKTTSGEAHPAHPSFFSFFYASCPKADYVCKLVGARRTFADIYALRMMDCIPDESGDVLLDKKVRAVEQVLAPYRLMPGSEKQ